MKQHKILLSDVPPDLHNRLAAAEGNDGELPFDLGPAAACPAPCPMRRQTPGRLHPLPFLASTAEEVVAAVVEEEYEPGAQIR